jgi:hypothetical protein
MVTMDDKREFTGYREKYLIVLKGRLFLPPGLCGLNINLAF